MANRDKNVGKHVFVFNPNDDREESLFLETEFFDNGNGPKTGIYTNQKLTLQSYRNSAEFNLIGISLNPDNLRKLANELESAMIQSKANCSKVAI